MRKMLFSIETSFGKSGNCFPKFQNYLYPANPRSIAQLVANCLWPLETIEKFVSEM